MLLQSCLSEDICIKLELSQPPVVVPISTLWGFSVVVGGTAHFSRLFSQLMSSCCVPGACVNGGKVFDLTRYKLVKTWPLTFLSQQQSCSSTIGAHSILELKSSRAEVFAEIRLLGAYSHEKPWGWACFMHEKRDKYTYVALPPSHETIMSPFTLQDCHVLSILSYSEHDQYTILSYLLLSELSH